MKIFTRILFSLTLLFYATTAFSAEVLSPITAANTGMSHALLTNVPLTNEINVGYIDDDSPASYTLDGKRKGISVELFEHIAEVLKLKVKYISYHNHKDAVSDLRKGNLSVLIGAFTHDPIYEDIGIVHSPIFFIDEDIIVSPKKHLSYGAVFDLIWTDLLRNTVIFSFLMSLLFWALLFIFEGTKHEILKSMTLFEKLSYTFFQIWACFLRDLLYDPVTNAGRILMSLWMFFSILMITVVTSIMTSTIIILNSESYSMINNVRQLHFQDVGFLEGHHSSEFAISLVGGHTVPFEYIGNLLEELADKDIDYGVVSKTILEDYLLYKPELKNHVVVSNVAAGYEGWVFLYNLNDKIYYDINTEMVHLVESGDLYSICAKYISHPEHCLVM